MNTLKSLAFALTVAVSSFGVGACGGVEGAVEDWADDACECKDTACANKQKTAFDKIESEYKGDIKEMSKSDLKKVEKHYRKGAKCLREFDVHAG